MINRVKISDGDMIFITIGGEDVTTAQMQPLQKVFETWVKDRGLQNVKISVCGGIDGKGMQIDVLSVNDIFEDVVLNGTTPQKS